MRFSSVFVLIFFLPVFAHSATIYVPDNHPTIQGAIDASAGGDMIIVRPGTYVENIDYSGKALVVKSEMGADVTTIDGNGSGNVVRFCSAEGAGTVLDGFTVTNGTGSEDSWGAFHGGGIMCDGSSPAIIDNTIVGNKAEDGSGGGIYCSGASPTISNNRIVWNWTWQGSGIYCSNSTATIEGKWLAYCCFSIHGGGIYCDSSSLDIVGNTIWGNFSLYSGGGIYCVGTSSLDISNNVIAENLGGDLGGGIFCDDSSILIIVENIIAGNRAENGGGICCAGSSTVTIMDNDIFGNRASSCGGGIFAGTADITNNLISGNSGGFYGGGIYCGGSAPTIANNIISKNSTNFAGGGISCGYYGDPNIVNNIIAHNDSQCMGGGIYCFQYSSPTIINSTIFGNSAYDFGGGIQAADASNPTVTNTICWDNSAPSGPEISVGHLNPSTLTISFSDVEGGQGSCHVESGCTLVWGAGMIVSDPLLADPASDDFHLTWNSPCRDVGDSAAVTEQYDFEGDPRIALGTVDIGADEYYYHLYHIGEVIPGSAIDVKVVGYPGAGVTLYLGSGLADPPYSTQHGFFWLNWPPQWQGNIGTVAQNGIALLSTTVPAWWVPGSEQPFQALVGPWGGGYTLFTNPMILEVE